MNKEKLIEMLDSLSEEKIGKILAILQEDKINDQFTVNPPMEVISYIKNNFESRNGVVYSKTGTVIGPWVYMCCKFNEEYPERYPKEYIECVLHNKTPNLSFLFEYRQDGLYRSYHSFWSNSLKGTKVRQSSVCGLTIKELLQVIQEEEVD